MGNFLALSGVIGKTHTEVLNALTAYANGAGGGIRQDDTLKYDDDNCCLIEEANGNTTVLYPNWYNEWDDTSESISKQLNATVFSLHIHDGDLWMYVLYNNGKIVDKFNPVPDYWDENLRSNEIKTWKGNASIIAKYVTYVQPKDIKNYLVAWDLDEEESTKAYSTDEFAKEDWQMLDFMSRLKLPYPLDDNGNANGQAYKLWTQKSLLNPSAKAAAGRTATKAKPWWKFW